MSAFPTLTDPTLGGGISPNSEFAYRDKRSSRRQADNWNQILRDDPIHGPASGFIVGVAPVVTQTDDGPRWELIWVSPASVGAGSE